MSRTLAQFIRDWRDKKEEYRQQHLEKPAELKIFNPLQLRIGDFLLTSQVPELAARKMVNLTIFEIDAAALIVGSKRFEHVDYLGSDGEQWCIVRVNPREDALPSAQQSDTTVLFLYCEIEFDQELVERVLPTGMFSIFDVLGDTSSAVLTFTRLNAELGIKDPWDVRLEKVTDPHLQFPAQEKIKMWDFGRTCEDGRTEYLYVEMSEENGKIQMFRGYNTEETNIFPVQVAH